MIFKLAYFAEYLKYFSEIINAASKSTLGIFALMILFIGLTALVFFKKEKVLIKLLIFSFLFFGVIAFGYKIYEVEPEKRIDHNTSKLTIPDKPLKDVVVEERQHDTSTPPKEAQ